MTTRNQKSNGEGQTLPQIRETMNQAELETRRELAVRPEPSIAILLQGVIEKGVTTENVAALDKLCDLYERMESKKSEREFNTAFAQLQNSMPQVEAKKAVPDKQGNVKYKYAPFDEIMEKVQPFLTQNGFSVSFDSEFGEGRITAICTLRHVSGHSQRNKFAVRIGGGPPGATETQSDGAAMTYAKRGALSNALNIVVDKDDDARMIGESITADQAAELRQRVREVGANEEAFLKFANAAHYEAIPANRYEALDTLLKRKHAEMKQPAGKEKRDAEGNVIW